MKMKDLLTSPCIVSFVATEVPAKTHLKPAILGRMRPVRTGGPFTLSLLSVREAVPFESVRASSGLEDSAAEFSMLQN